MANKFIPLVAMSALALAACQEKSTTSVAIDGNAATTTEAVTGEAAPANMADSASLPTSIPAPLQGRWGLVPADCTSTKGDAKGLLIIGATNLKFYESRGTVAKVMAGGADSFDADYAFTGEGQEWHRIEKLKLADGKLKRQSVTQAGEEPGVDLSYDRCPA